VTTWAVGVGEADRLTLSFAGLDVVGPPELAELELPEQELRTQAATTANISWILILISR